MNDEEEYMEKFPEEARKKMSKCYDSLRRYFDGGQKLQSNSDRDSTKEIITFNVSGIIIQVYRSTLLSHPKSLLADEELLKPYWNNHRKLYFLNRDYRSFKAVIRFYRTGMIIRPKDVGLVPFLKELKFYKIETKHLINFLESENILLDEESSSNSGYVRSSRLRLFLYLDSPLESLTGLLISFLRIAIIISMVGVEIVGVTNPTSITDGVIIAGNSALLVDILARVSLCPPHRRKSYLTSMLVLDDIATACAFVLFLLVVNISGNLKTPLRTNVSGALYCFQTIQLLHVTKLLRKNRMVYTLSMILKRRKADLSQMLGLMLITAAIFGALQHLAELGLQGHSGRTKHPGEGSCARSSNDTVEFALPDIPTGTWWSIVTMFTVGYGDILLNGVPEKVFAVIMIYVSILVTSLTVPFLCDMYNDYYSKDESLRWMATMALAVTPSETENKRPEEV